jgi:hypothetical protein
MQVEYRLVTVTLRSNVISKISKNIHLLLFLFLRFRSLLLSCFKVLSSGLDSIYAELREQRNPEQYWVLERA